MRKVMGLAALSVAVVLSAAAADVKPDAAAIYKAKCTSCHGKDGKGNEKMLKMFKVEAKDMNLIDEGTLAEKDEDLSKFILTGKKKMPSFKDKLMGLDVAELVKYIRGLNPVETSKAK